MERTYGPTGRPAQIGTTDSSHVLHWESIHWDGEAVLFSTNAAGQVDDIKVGALADYMPMQSASHQLTMWDRDSTGKARASHGEWGNYGWAGADSYVGSGSTTITLLANGGSAAIGQGGGLFQGTIDGYQDGFVIIQGARDYDPASRGWIERDPNGGSDWEPMTQKSFAWNNNNPESFSDPSGTVPMGFGYEGQNEDNFDDISGWFSGDQGERDAAVAGALIAEAQYAYAYTAYKQATADALGDPAKNPTASDAATFLAVVIAKANRNLNISCGSACDGYQLGSVSDCEGAPCARAANGLGEIEIRDEPTTVSVGIFNITYSVNFAVRVYVRPDGHAHATGLIFTAIPSYPDVWLGQHNGNSWGVFPIEDDTPGNPGGGGYS